ncbi:molybdopterin-guanine dinucleotide biosynthesis protein A [Gillisia sp. Hel_I_86]|uniref:NTP transferase domain-containing protein n=1 Tax=Gillisia sp. Hel_I_86 TaxID=1249981 RepID=UPI00119ADA5B|nr:NTP transferase domain-containing protein [Gillisia sp. Hel_I_86]TVZ27130.1 molybdopterin-guanine dinucleotide biosynthesis protein A [Gillisia sp. Hel_I_86]
MKHEQHSKLTKPDKGFYGRNEISILGSNCNRIQTLASSIGKQLQDEFSVAYVDADHASHTDNEKESPSVAFTKNFINKITHHQFNVFNTVSKFEQDTFFNSSQLILVNGNHEKANHQIVMIDKKKEASLIKRKEALTNVIALVRTDHEDKEIPEYIKELIPKYAELPVFLLTDEKIISGFVKKLVENRIPKIQGLILGGGKSTRMGVDKVFMKYHGVSQHTYLQEILSPFCEDVFVSCRPDQASLFPDAITDSFLGLGAYGGLLSAFQKNPDSAWFSIACDIPLLNKETLEALVSKRNPSKVATCFYNSETDFPEPLITIWEPRAYAVLLHYLSLGYSCPRKVLINSDVEIVKLENEDVLLNANTSKERDKVLELLSKTIS